MQPKSSDLSVRSPCTPRWLLVLLCLLPAIQTAVAVYWEIYPALTYPLLKVAMIVVPLLLWRLNRWKAADVAAAIGLKRSWCIAGLLLGSLMAVVILSGYYIALRSLLDGRAIAEKVQALGLKDHYLAMALAISLWNAGFEEYYWRGFLFSELRARFSSAGAAVVVGGALFGLHHVFALMPLFSWQLTVMFTFGTMAAGGVWSLMRRAGLSILDCYVSHILADLAIMWIGWDLMQMAV